MHLDTHVAVWLYQGDIERIPIATRESLGRVRPLVSPMVRIELELLHEIGRLTVPAAVILDELRSVAGLGVAESRFDRVAAIAAGLKWTRDPFDRMIAAHALADDLPLVTKDQVMLSECAVARWG